MTELDQAIQDSLRNLVDQAGDAPALSDITVRSRDVDHRPLSSIRTLSLIVVAVVTLLGLAGGAFWLASLDDVNVAVIAADPEKAGSTSATSTDSATPQSTTEQPTTTPPTATEGLPGGLPGSWLGISTSNDLVDVDTASGEATIIVEEAGSANASENTILDRAHRQPGTDVIWATSSRDPAGGAVFRIDQAPVTDSWFSFGFDVKPSPDGQLIAIASFNGLNLAATSDPDELTTVSDTQPFGNNSIAWLRAGHRVIWTYPDTTGDPGFILEIIELADGIQQSERRQTTLPPDLAGVVTVTINGDNNVVVTGCTTNTFEACDTSRTVVLDGETLDIIDELDLAAGARLGGYDPSDRFLIYTDGAGIVRWYSEEGTGILGEGYTWASW